MVKTKWSSKNLETNQHGLTWVRWNSGSMCLLVNNGIVTEITLFNAKNVNIEFGNGSTPIIRNYSNKKKYKLIEEI